METNTRRWVCIQILFRTFAILSTHSKDNFKYSDYKTYVYPLPTFCFSSASGSQIWEMYGKYMHEEEMT